MRINSDFSNYYSLIAAFLFLESSFSNADVLPPDVAMFSTNVVYSSATSMWNGDEETDFPDSGKRDYSEAGVRMSYGVAYEMQVNLAISYANFEMVKGDKADAKEGDVNGGLKEVGFSLDSDLYAGSGYGISGSFGVRAPGNDDSGNQFLSINDGTTKYDFGLNLAVDLAPVSLGLGTKYVHRAAKYSADQNIHSLNLGYSYELGSIGLALTHFSTQSGSDIGDEKFQELTEKLGGPAFSATAVQFTSLALVKNLVVSDFKYLNFFLGRKLSGENTDISTSFGVGYTQVLL